uniref:Uncharacterized protein n=1 Tax=Tanacetum cinerariifolium TaxID=118510 RepID=A0A6L2K4N4_TANCI|nr:hypothetical protein [Tanacetum cinerariifolium]
MKRLFRVTQLDALPEFIGPWGMFGDPGQTAMASSTWMTFGGNTVTWAHLEKKQTRLRTCTNIHQEVLFLERGDSVAGIKRRRLDLSGDGVWILATVSQRSGLKVDLEPSTWRRRQDHKATSSRRYVYIYKTDLGF